MNIWSMGGILEKNRLANDKPFLLLMRVKHKSLSEPIYLARNNDDVVWNGITWVRFPIGLDNMTQDGKETASLNLKVSNLGGVIQTYVQQNNGFTDATVTLYVVHAAHLDNTVPEFTLTMTCTATKYDESWVTFSLSSDTDFSWSFPPDRYMQDFCRFRFKGPRCGYVGNAAECNGTLATCRIPSRFGGEPGVTSGS